MEIREFQDKIKRLYFSRDSQRGRDATFLWLVEEMGELSKALRRNDSENIKEELADVVAWSASLANILNLDLETILYEKYKEKCFYCGESPCVCKKK
ncbi:MAG TPA: MazG nucleotide pyrophosphohydrolase domain-containing protein [bacterium]|nr:MazG nucleotide pyrophosphohydrolase domain-containing protein [bacterium]